jgi:hypothetical protein
MVAAHVSYEATGICFSSPAEPPIMKPMVPVKITYPFTTRRLQYGVLREVFPEKPAQVMVLS